MEAKKSKENKNKTMNDMEKKTEIILKSLLSKSIKNLK